MFDNSFAWDQLPQDVLLDPLGPKSSSSTSIYSLIWGVELSSGPKFSKIEAIKSHLELLQGYSDGLVENLLVDTTILTFLRIY